MDCRNHAGKAAASRCAGCAEPFCSDCLVEIGGKQYCAACKTLAVQGGQPVIEEATLPCKQASDALTYAIIGIFCLGIILEPIAIIKALKAKKMIEANPRLTGSGKATAALIIGIVFVILNVLYIINLVVSVAQS